MPLNHSATGKCEKAKQEKQHKEAGLTLLNSIMMKNGL